MGRCSDQMWSVPYVQRRICKQQATMEYVGHMKDKVIYRGANWLEQGKKRRKDKGGEALGSN